jgi:hypothetical protein
MQRVAIVCLRVEQWLDESRAPRRRHRALDRHIEVTFWASLTEAVQAERELCRPVCGPTGCEGVHAVCYTDDTGRPRVVRYAAPLRSLAEQLAALYPRMWPSDTSLPPESWPAPAGFNEPLSKPRGSDLHARLERGEAVALAREVATVP